MVPAGGNHGAAPGSRGLSKNQGLKADHLGITPEVGSACFNRSGPGPDSQHLFRRVVVVAGAGNVGAEVADSMPGRNVGGTPPSAS